MSDEPTTSTTEIPFKEKIEEGAKETAAAAAGYGKRFAVWAEGHPGLVAAFALGAIFGFVIGMLWPG